MPERCVRSCLFDSELPEHILHRFDLLGVAGHLDDDGVRTHVDYVGAERLGYLHYLTTRLGVTRNLVHREFAVDGVVVGQVADLYYGYDLV